MSNNATLVQRRSQFIRHDASSVALRHAVPRALLVVLALAFVVTILWSLATLIAPAFSYAGYEWEIPKSLPVLGGTLLLAIAPTLFLPIDGYRPGNLIAWILYVVAYVPIQLVPVFASGNHAWESLPFQLATLAGLGLIAVATRFPVVRIPSLSISARTFWMGALVVSLSILALTVATYGLPTRLPALTDVYDVRADFHADRAGVSTITILMMSWQQKVINPLLIAGGIVRKSPLLIIAGVVGQLVLFGISGQKSVFFSGLMVVAVITVMSLPRRWTGSFVLVGAGGLVLVAGATDHLLNSVTISSLFVRRLMLTPGLLSGYYYDFFSVSPKVYLSNSILSRFQEYPYDVSIPRLIGIHYFNNDRLNANANIWADAYAQAGIAGILGFSLILAAVIVAFNSLALDRSLLVTSALAGMAAWTLTDTALFISLNTHGVLFSLLVLFLLPRNVQVNSAGHSGTARAATRKKRHLIYPGAMRRKS